jgi:thiol:disulfide interchange protein
MNETPKARKFGLAILAILLWLIAFALGLEDIYAIRELSMLAMMSMGNTSKDAINASLGVVYVVAFLYLIFLIGSTEYHFKHFNTPKSWRLFGWTLGVEVVIYIVYRIL